MRNLGRYFVVAEGGQATNDLPMMERCKIKIVSRETPMLAANRLTQISNERKPANGRLFWYKIKVGKNAAYKTRQLKLWTALLS